MPESQLSDERDTNRKRALLSVERALRHHVGGSLERLDLADIRSTYGSRYFSEGWRFSVAFSDGITRRIDVIVSESFPNVPPRAALVDRPDYLTWPHIEHDGILCLLTNLSEVDPNDPADVALNIANRAVTLVEELIEGTIVERDFREEYLTYWFYGASDSAKDVVTLFDPPSESRLVRSFRHDGFVYVAESDDSLATWIENRFGAKVARRVRNHTEPVAYVWLAQPPLPGDYPKTGADALALAESKGPRAGSLVSEAALHNGAKFLCLFGAEGRGGPGLVPVHINRSDQRTGMSRRDKNQIHRGFRPGRTPDAIKLAKTFGTSAVRRAQVARADGPWIHGRGKDVRSRVLLDKSVTVFGCGSVGSFVVEDLARSGVGSINLVDNDNLEWANVGRHVLGATSVGKNKAVELAARLQRKYPHLAISGFDASATGVIESDRQHLLDVDLIVSAMGNWGAESALNRWHNDTGRQFPIVYGWTEDHALAGSTVAIAHKGGCLACGLNRVGAPTEPTTIWQDAQDLHTEPSCADHYRPYGAIELSGTTSLVSGMALDELLAPSLTSYKKIWIGRLETLSELGGSINPQLAKQIGVDIRGSQTLSARWPDGLCPHCAQRQKTTLATGSKLELAG